MHPEKCRLLSYPALSSTLLLAMAASPLSLHAQTWDGNGAPNLGGNWSTANLWSSDTVPSAGHTAILPNTGADRTIAYDSGASGALGTLTFEQTSAFANILEIQRSLNVTSPITLGATNGGIARIVIGSSSSAGFIFTPSGGITLNSGGNLVLTATGNGGTGFNSSGTGGTNTVNIQGGTLTVAATTGTSTGANASNTLSMGLTMSSGALTIDNATGVSDRRLLVQGTVNISGGDITSTKVGAGGILTLSSTSNITFNPASFDTDLVLTLDSTSAQSLSTNKTLGVFQVRGTGVKTLTSTAAGNTIGALQLFDNNSATANSATTLKLGSNLTYAAGAGMPSAQSFGNTHELGRIDLGIDTNGNTLDLSAGASSGAWTPNSSSQSGVTNTVWTLSGGGVIKANNFNFTATNVTTNVAASTVINAVGGNGTANNLGGAGTIDGNSVFRYSGTAAPATPATLTANRNLGDLEVNSGALKLLTGSTGTIQDLRVSGGTLDLDANTTRSFATISLTGGTLANGTYALSSGNYTGLQTGTVSGKLTGAGVKLVKDSAGTLTLSGNNDFTGAVEIKSGVLAITSAAAFTGTSQIDVMGGTLDLGGTNNLQKFAISLTNGGVIQNGALLRNSATNYTWSDGTVSAALTTGASGQINLIKNTTGTLTLSGSTANTHAGTTTVNGGTLVLAKTAGLDALVGNITIGDGATTAGNDVLRLDSSHQIADTSVVSLNGSDANAGILRLNNQSETIAGLSSAAGNGIVENGHASAGTSTLTLNVPGGSQSFGGVLRDNDGSGAGVLAFAKTGAGTQILSGANTYTGATTISGGTLALGASGSIANSAVVNLGGSESRGVLDLVAKGAAFSFASGQTVSGYGTIASAGTVVVPGVLAPGNSAGVIGVEGNLTLTADTTTRMEIVSRDGVAGAAFDQISVTGTLNFDGALVIDTTGLSGLSAGDGFLLFAAGSYGSAGLDSVSMTGVYAINGFTNTLGVWAANDITHSLRFTFNESTGYLAVGAIPEPSAAAMLGGFGALCWTLGRRRRSRR